MMFKKFLFISVLSLLIFSACNTITPITTTNTPEKEESSIPELTGDWSITMTHSGGIMGLMRFIEINSSGNYTVTDERTNETFTGQLSKNELDHLIQIFNATKFSENTKPYGCADCFVFDIQVISGERRFSAQVDDFTIGESGLEPLIDELRKIIEREIP